MKQIYDSGFSRIPIYEEDRNNIVGILHLRDLTFIDPDDCIPVRQVRPFTLYNTLLCDTKFSWAVNFTNFTKL